jgi:hypothetical protein
MLTLILVFTGFLILAVIGVIIDALTRHIIFLTGANRYELKEMPQPFFGISGHRRSPRCTGPSTPISRQNLRFIEINVLVRKI